MRHSKPVRLKTAPTGGESIYLFLEFTIVLKRVTPDEKLCWVSLSVYKQVLLDNQGSIVADRNSRLIVQPNLRTKITI